MHLEVIGRIAYCTVFAPEFHDALLDLLPMVGFEIFGII
jgi:hypothetical protein